MSHAESEPLQDMIEFEARLAENDRRVVATDNRKRQHIILLVLLSLVALASTIGLFVSISRQRNADESQQGFASAVQEEQQRSNSTLAPTPTVINSSKGVETMPTLKPTSLEVLSDVSTKSPNELAADMTIVAPTTEFPTPIPESSTEIPTPQSSSAVPSTPPTTIVSTPNPSETPSTSTPTSRATDSPTTNIPSAVFTDEPSTLEPSSNPTDSLRTDVPTHITSSPSEDPTKQPNSEFPTAVPSKRPNTVAPTTNPTEPLITISPTSPPTEPPDTAGPTKRPTSFPTSGTPTTELITRSPITNLPTTDPTEAPTPTENPTETPTKLPSENPSELRPIAKPITSSPTSDPTISSTSVRDLPTDQPSSNVSFSPTGTVISSDTESSITTTFYAIGDVPHSSGQAYELKLQMDDLASDAEFLIHLGNVRKAGTHCTKAELLEASELLQLSSVPVFVVIGENEYNECEGENAAVEGLEMWRDEFVDFHRKHWNHSFTVTHHPDLPETFAFVHKDALFLGLNLVGGIVHSESEWTTRLEQQATWTIETIRQYVSDMTPEIGRVLLFGHADPTNSHAAFFGPIVDFIEYESHGTPVLYLHGGSRREWEYEPYFFNVEHFLRMVTTGKAVDPPLQIKVIANGAASPTSVAFLYDRMLDV